MRALRLKTSLFTFFFVLFTSILFAQEQPKKSFWQKLNPNALANRKLSFVPIPVVQSSPETGLKVGVALDYFFNTDKDTLLDEKPTRDSYAWIQALYSFRNQVAIEPSWQIYTKDEQWFLRGRGGYLDFNERFWGIGNQTLGRTDYADIFYNRYYFQGRVLKKIHQKFFAGLNYNYSNTQNIDLEGAPPSIFGEALGTERSMVSGLGTTFSFDYRNNPFSPTRGWFLDVSFTHHYHKFGSAFNYKEIQIDFRKYFRIGKQDFLGFQTFVHSTKGDVPLRELPRLGGPNMMRGYFMGRYRDKQLWATQVEYRKPLGKLLVAAAFTSVGGVAPELRSMKISDLRYTYGAGLRIMVNKAKHLYARFDFAMSTEGDSGFYFRIADAF